MARLAIGVFFTMLTLSFLTYAATGSGDSAIGRLDTVSPTLTSVAVASDTSVTVTFSEPLLVAGSLTAGNYALSGAGVGTLSEIPSAISGDGPYTASWTSGEMVNGSPFMLTVTGVRDSVGNPIDLSHNTASASGVAEAPTFSNISVTPPQAAAGTSITIQFTVSEKLDVNPSVTINGNPATIVGDAKSVDYEYQYTVRSTDAAGLATIVISGMDLAGNIGSLNDSVTLEIVKTDAGLPLSAWSIGAALAVAGVIALARKRRFTAMLILAIVFSASYAFADVPLVSNVAFTQTPNGSGGTQVDIHYDLVAPNGPCEISVSLSKDGGSDGFIHPVTSVTGDLYGVETGAGYHIVWDIRSDYPGEDLANAQIRVTADDGFPQFALNYAAGANGSISGDASQEVVEGSNGAAVTAVADTGYHFVQWSDGSTRNPRLDSNVTKDVSVTATFAIDTFSLTYESETNGSISGETSQTVGYGTSGAAVTAVPETGYHFVRWSDDSTQNPRTDLNVTADISVVAAFAINTYSLTYAAGSHGTITGHASQTVFHGGSAFPVTAVADSDYIFLKWSDDSTQNPRADSNVTADISVTAVFISNTCTLTYTAGSHGTITGDASQTVLRGGSGSQVTAVADSGYIFSQWSDGVTTAARTDSNVTADISVTANFITAPEAPSLSINNGADATSTPTVTLNNSCTNNPTHYMASESSSFVGALWAEYSAAPSFVLSDGIGPRTVYFKVKNAAGESAAASDEIFVEPEMVNVDAGKFLMGRTSSKLDAMFGASDEQPQHLVSLWPYSVGKFEITNKDFCDLLNWANSQGYLYGDAEGAPWTGSGDIYAGNASGARYPIFGYDSSVDITYSDGAFSTLSRMNKNSTVFSMANNPVVNVSWYGAVAFCNWLSEWEGLTECYDMSKAEWPLIVAPPTPGGYRLPTEAEWERAAAWDGTTHWTDAFMADTCTWCSDLCNVAFTESESNPLYLEDTPYTSPVGWFNGTNYNLRTNRITLDSPSPAGAYDMTGNAEEWCGDWYKDNYYIDGATTNPTGPENGTYRCIRGGYWWREIQDCRTASRFSMFPAEMLDNAGLRIAKSEPDPGVITFTINNNALISDSVDVTLNNYCANTPTLYMASESSSFTGASWMAYNAAAPFKLSGAIGERTVYFKVKNSFGESNVLSDKIFLPPTMVSVSAGTFTMGATSEGDDATYGDSGELPAHSVKLGAYDLGKYEVTNQEFCDVLNWANSKGYLFSDDAETAWSGSGDIYAGNAQGAYYVIYAYDSTTDITYSNGEFAPLSREGANSTLYSMANNPVVWTSWFGAVAFCNWLSEWQGLTQCYDMSSENWPITTAPPTVGGYRLPTEAEWERAAAWGESKHWAYGFLADVNASGTTNRCNDGNDGAYDNPLGLTETPYTTPVGWFNGANVNPNDALSTVDGPSPVGAYDMSGNVGEWCGDWFSPDYYSGGAMTNPTGADTGSARVFRGGAWCESSHDCRSARRGSSPQSLTHQGIGFRIAESKTISGGITFSINNGALISDSVNVTLNSYCANTPTLYMASESSDFTGASWMTYNDSAPFTLSGVIGERTVYFKVKYDNGESTSVSDSIFISTSMISIAEGTFTMGNSGVDDDLVFTSGDELPTHSVTLGAYSLGKYEVTIQEFCDVLNWAKSKGYLKGSLGEEWIFSNSSTAIYAGNSSEALYPLCDIRNSVYITYSNGVFSALSRVAPGGISYSMANHPVMGLSWYGAVAFCNWLSEWQGLTQCYNMSAEEWPLVVAPSASGGYRLPTEAEWERAAAWDGSKHWVYGDVSGKSSLARRFNCCWDNSDPEIPMYVDPLHLSRPYSAPVGWFNGTTTLSILNWTGLSIDSPTATGAYDMSGNATEWCNDWYSADYYNGGSMINPTGPTSGKYRVIRGGSWCSRDIRTAVRNGVSPVGEALSDEITWYTIGFRLTRIP